MSCPGNPDIDIDGIEEEETPVVEPVDLEEE